VFVAAPAGRCGGGYATRLASNQHAICAFAHRSPAGQGCDIVNDPVGE
jgi:hypothetical protein